jgi:hypothetical protein
MSTASSNSDGAVAELRRRVLLLLAENTELKLRVAALMDAALPADVRRELLEEEEEEEEEGRGASGASAGAGPSTSTSTSTSSPAAAAAAAAAAEGMTATDQQPQSMWKTCQLLL